MKNEPIQNEPETAGQLLVNAFYDLFDIVIPALLVVSFLFLFFLRTAGVDGDSMNTTLANYDRLLMTNLFYEPQQGDIVIINRFHPGDETVEEPLIKRVIAVAGDTVKVEGEYVTVNGEILDEPYVHFKNVPRYDEITVPEGCVFVLGDHRDNSKDSREFGPFRVEEIMGKAIWRLFPAKDFGDVYYNLPSEG